MDLYHQNKVTGKLFCSFSKHLMDHRYFDNVGLFKQINYSYEKLLPKSFRWRV